jgi:hypothetical protein
MIPHALLQFQTATLREHLHRREGFLLLGQMCLETVRRPLQRPALMIQNMMQQVAKQT